MTEHPPPDAKDFADIADPAADVLATADEYEETEDVVIPELDVVHTFDHDVPIGDGRTMRLTESLSLRGQKRIPPRRAVLMIDSFNRLGFRIPVEGYNGPEMLAAKGIFAFTVDLLGMGESYRPPDGLDATFKANIRALRRVIEYIRFLREVPKVDLIGEGYGAALATQLADDDARIRSCVLSTAIYKQTIGGPIISDELAAKLQQSPDGYIDFPKEVLGAIFAASPPEIRKHFLATQKGSYPTPNFLEALEPPFFYPDDARVPGLVIAGSKDPIVPPSDPRQLAQHFGTGGAWLVVIKGAGHGPRVESPEAAAKYWDEIFDFISA